jgi:hypothetical protein
MYFGFNCMLGVHDAIKSPSTLHVCTYLLVMCLTVVEYDRSFCACVRIQTCMHVCNSIQYVRACFLMLFPLRAYVCACVYFPQVCVL